MKISTDEQTQYCDMFHIFQYPVRAISEGHTIGIRRSLRVMTFLAQTSDVILLKTIPSVPWALLLHLSE